MAAQRPVTDSAPWLDVALNTDRPISTTAHFQDVIPNSVLSEASGKLVFADELESITEPGASARIIAGILEYLSGNEQSLGIFVSHLSELILENTETIVRVDGIEAEGLDSNLELIVNRNPVYNHVARSTPELIVERLLRQTSGREREFYAHLKGKFKAA